MTTSIFLLVAGLTFGFCSPILAAGGGCLDDQNCFAGEICFDGVCQRKGTSTLKTLIKSEFVFGSSAVIPKCKERGNLRRSKVIVFNDSGFGWKTFVLGKNDEQIPVGNSYFY